MGVLQPAASPKDSHKALILLVFKYMVAMVVYLHKLLLHVSFW